jgi:putative MATE family efflux protein
MSASEAGPAEPPSRLQPNLQPKRQPNLQQSPVLSGSVWVNTARFGFPLALGMGLQTSFNLVDAYIIARLPGETSSHSLAAIGICDQIAALGTIISYGISIATGTLLSRRHGAGDHEGVQRVAWQSLLILLAMSTVVGLFGLLAPDFVMRDLIGAKGEIARLGANYLQVMVGGSFTIFLLLHLTTILRSLGSSKTPIVFLVAANVINLVLAVLLVYGPGVAPDVFAWGPPIAQALGLPRLELMGAAWATVIARLVPLVPLLFIVAKRFDVFERRTRTPPNWNVIRQILRLAWPMSSQLVVRILGIILLISLVTRAYSTVDDQFAVTALGIVLRLETMALFVSLGWGSAAQTFIGQNMGALQLRRAFNSGLIIALYDSVMMAAFSVFCWFEGDHLIAFFDAHPQVVETAHHYLRWVGPSYVGLGVGIVLGAAIQGAGAARQTLLMDLGVICLLQLPLSLLVSIFLQLPAVALWQVMALTYTCFAVLYLLTYRRGRFLRTRS